VLVPILLRYPVPVRLFIFWIEVGRAPVTVPVNVALVTSIPVVDIFKADSVPSPSTIAVRAEVIPSVLFVFKSSLYELAGDLPVRELKLDSPKDWKPGPNLY
jgi:hypothetical protein